MRVPRAVATGTDRVYNFSAGPAAIFEDVLETAQKEMLSWHGSGMSVMEMSHRGKEFMTIIQEAESDLRELLQIPSNYKVLFMQGGASTQFSALPLNLTSADDVTDYIVTGSWGSKAYKEAQKYCKANLAATTKDSSFTVIPDQSEWKLTPGAKYVHICANETIQGVEFKHDPTVDGCLIADMSSNFCSKQVDVSKYGIIYAGAQKNVGPAGVTIVIIREDLIGHARPETPVMLDYQIMAENDSLYNTPPCWSIYMCGLVFKKLLSMGGLSEVEKHNQAKAAVLYDAIQASNGYFKSPVAENVRSSMNVPFTMDTPELEKEFLGLCQDNGLIQLKGHRSVGGMRASIYNAMPVSGVERLAQLMKEFQASH
eukprot:jgi/Pico_ML_1/54463/g4807.t1